MSSIISSAVSTVEGAALSAASALIPGGVFIIPQGNIGGVAIQATIEEMLTDTLEVTEHPVEAGAMISDHAYARPYEIQLRCGWTNSGQSSIGNSLATLSPGSTILSPDYVSSVYSQLLALMQPQANGPFAPFTVLTSIRSYTSMLMTSLSLTRDAKTSNALMIVANLRQVIIVTTTSTTLPPTVDQANPASTSETTSVGTVAPVATTQPQLNPELVLGF